MKTLFIKYPKLIKFLPRKLKNNKSWLREIIEQNTESFQYVSDDIKNDKDYILSFLQSTPIDFLHGEQGMQKTGSTYKQDEWKNYYKLFEYADNSLKQDFNFLISIMSYAQNVFDLRFYSFLPENIKKSSSFWIELIKKTNSLYFIEYAIKVKNTYISNIFENSINDITTTKAIEILFIYQEKEKFEHNINGQVSSTQAKKI